MIGTRISKPVKDWNEYTRAARWCNENGARIVEKDEYYEVVEKPKSEAVILKGLRRRREAECFPVINRGKLWYDNLTISHLRELQTWYQAWLDVTETKAVPEKPEWLE